MELVIILILSILCLSLLGITIFFFKKSIDSTNRVNLLSEYYENTHKILNEVFSSFIIHNENGVRPIIAHPYAGEDPVIRNFLKSLLEFDKFFREKISQYNTTTNEILNEQYGIENEAEKTK